MSEPDLEMTRPLGLSRWRLLWLLLQPRGAVLCVRFWGQELKALEVIVEIAT